MSRSYRLVCLSSVLSPLTHMARSEGNRGVLMREEVMTPAGIRSVPCLTGNALRHRLVRGPGTDWLVERYGLRERLNLTQLNYLFHGGALTEGGGREDTRRIADMQRLFPLSRLLGGCLPDQILEGNLLVSRGVLVCEENRARLECYLGAAGGGVGDDGASLLPQRLRPADSFVSEYQYTRGDIRKKRSRLLPGPDAPDAPDGPTLTAWKTELKEIARAKKPTAAQQERTAELRTRFREWEHLDVSEDVDSNLMIFSGQAVMAGAAFLHDFLVPNASRVELGALLLSLALWAESGGTIGGQSARGHGRLQTCLVGEDDPWGAIDEYIAHADASREEAVAWLDRVFRRPARGTPEES